MEFPLRGGGGLINSPSASERAGEEFPLAFGMSGGGIGYSPSARGGGFPLRYGGGIFEIDVFCYNPPPLRRGN